MYVCNIMKDSLSQLEVLVRIFFPYERFKQYSSLKNIVIGSLSHDSLSVGIKGLKRKVNVMPTYVLKFSVHIIVYPAFGIVPERSILFRIQSLY